MTTLDLPAEGFRYPSTCCPGFECEVLCAIEGVDVISKFLNPNCVDRCFDHLPGVSCHWCGVHFIGVEDWVEFIGEVTK